MSLYARTRSWLRSITRPSLLHEEMDDELRFHIDRYIEDLVRSGMSLPDATRRARIEFGSSDAHKEAMRRSLGLGFWDELRSDLSYGLRMLRKSPSFTAVAVISLTLGIGVNTAVFTLAKQVLLDQLAVPHPEQLRLLSWVSTRKSAVHSLWGDWDKVGDQGATSTSFSYPVYQHLRAQNHSLSDLFAFKDVGRMNITVDRNAEVVQGELVSGNYYEQMQVKPQLGRAIESYDDEKPGGSPVVVISDAFWARRFNRSPSVIGKTILLNLTNVTIVGVNPARFTGAKSVQVSPEIFAPFSMQPMVAPNAFHGNLLTSTKLWWVQIIARPRSGVSVTEATAQLDLALKDAVRFTMNPKPEEALPDLRILDGSRGLNESSRMFEKPVYVLGTLVGIVLLLACANIANLLLARSASRQRELSVRIALGATRARVVRQILTESLLLSAIGGLGGLLLGFLGRNAIPRMVSNSWEPATPITSLDGRVFAFTATLTLVTGLLFGLIPAWQATRTQVNSALKDSAQTSTRRRKGLAGKTIVGFQVALSTLLVIGAALFLRTLINLGSIDPGFDAHHVVLFELQPPQTRYPQGKSSILFRQIEERLASVPGVESVSSASIPLLSNSMSSSDFTPTGQQPAPGKEVTANNNAVGDRYFETMRIPIVAGRGFQPTDTETSLKVAVVNRALVKQFFPNENPLGKTFTTDDSRDGKLLYQIVGVCADARYATLRDEPPPIFYVSYRQAPDLTWGMTFAVRTSLPRHEITRPLIQAVQSVDRDLPLTDIRTQQEQIDAYLQQERIFASLTLGFGVLALILAVIGIYGIMSYSVARRTNEIGIRLALGARTRQVLAMVLFETSWLAFAGVLVGMAVALFLIRYVRSMLYGLKNFDPVSLLVASMLLLGVSLLAGFVPARRAARVQPMEALRHE